MSWITADRARRDLLRALAPHLGAYALLAESSRDWASALFEGAQHRLAIALDGEAAVARAGLLQATLAEVELAMRGGFVADIAVTARLDAAQSDEGRPVLAIEALTIEDPVAVSRARRVG